MDSNVAVKELYEKFPYPPPVTDLRPYLEGELSPTWNLRDSFPIFFPEREFTDDLDVLVAGCGTRAAVMMAATSPASRFVAVDISEHSLQLSEDTARAHGLDNLEHHLLPLEEVGSLGKDFDFIHCHGVLHHLADPGRGLRALSSVLRPEGSAGLMVYAPHGRAGVYLLQDLCEHIGLPLDEVTAVKLQELLGKLPERHPFYLSGHDRTRPINLPEVVDMLMHPRDVSYTVYGVRDLLAESGVKFHRWLGQARYTLEGTGLARTALGINVASLDHWGQAAVMEGYLGTLKTHSFVVTHPERRSAREIFSGEGLLDAIPVQAAHVGHDVTEDRLTLFSRAHDPIHRKSLAVDVDRERVPLLFKCFVPGRTIREIIEKETKNSSDPMLGGWILRTCRRLYTADIIDLRSKSSP